MTIRRGVALAVILAMVGTSAGCEGLKRKFIRKRTPPRAAEPIFALEREYRPEFPPDVRYQAHFAYWKAAHDDLLDGLTQATQHRRVRAARQAIKELRAMQGLLEEPLRHALGQLIDEMTAVERQVEDPRAPPPRLAIMRSALESLRRRIDAGYDFHQVKHHLKADVPSQPHVARDQ